MKKILAVHLLMLVVSVSVVYAQDAPYANPLTVEISRRITKELLGPNSTPFMKPLVVVSNATSNSRFFRQAFVPKKVDKPYFKVGLHGMVGGVRDDQKTYTPVAPRATLEEVLTDADVWTIDFPNNIVTIHDTAGLITNILKYLFDKGLGVDSATSGITFPKTAATVFGFRDGRLTLSKDYFLQQIKGGDTLLSFAFSRLNPAIQDTVLKAIEKLPGSLALPTGGNVSTVFAGIPQFEIGSLWGTELLLRFIPPIKLDKNIGDFAFWGIGLKHSLSQYFTPDEPDKKPWCDLAVQAVYQGTRLSNKIGVTQATLTANATIWDVNVQASKSIASIVDIFTGLSYEHITIQSSYEYTLPVEIQMDLGLLRKVEVGVTPKPEPELGYPGDQKPQKVESTITDTNVKWIIGLAREFGPIAIFADYSVSKFNVLSGGIEVRF